MVFFFIYAGVFSIKRHKTTLFLKVICICIFNICIKNLNSSQLLCIDTPDPVFVITDDLYQCWIFFILCFIISC